MAKRVGKYKITQRESALNLTDGGVVDGDLQIPTINPVSGSASAITVTKATHGGRTTIIPQTDAAVTHIIPKPEEGVHYHFVYAGMAAAGHNVAFDITENGVFEGAITFLHEGNNDSVDVVYCDKANNDLLTAVTPQSMDIHLVGKSATEYYVYGSVASAETPTCANG